jgi:hypothetical protein
MIIELGVTFAISNIATVGIIRLAEKFGLTIPVNTKSKQKAKFTRYKFSCYSGIIIAAIITLIQSLSNNALNIFIQNNIAILGALSFPYLLYLFLLLIYAIILRRKFPKLDINMCNIFPEKRLPIAGISALVTSVFYSLFLVI